MQKIIVVLAVCCCVLPEMVAIKTSANSTSHLRKMPKAQEASRDVRMHTPHLPDSVRSVVASGQWRAEPKEDKRKLMDMISQFRAQVCADMMKKNGEKFESFESCKDFMKETCKPGKDGVMDKDKKEITSGKGYCDEYFHAEEAEEEIKKEIEAEEVLEEAEMKLAPLPAPMPAPAPAPAPAPEKEAPAPAPAPEEEAPAPAPAKEAPAPAPLQGPVPAPAPVPHDEKYYFEEGGKSPARLHMDESLKLPAQGYWGKLVEHEDQKTITADWGQEFGPAADHRNMYQICKDHPDNAWCRNQGYHKRSLASKQVARLVPFVVPFVLLAFDLA